jgi:DNA topoisomerase I
MTAKRTNGKSYKRLYVFQSAQSAKAAGLRYCCDTSDGIRRIPSRNGAFRYVAPGGSTVGDAATLARIKALVIPPAWREVWIALRDDCHLQAVGRDARGRKQYRYHRRWREVRDETKYGRLAAFAKVLPRIRRRVREHLALPGLPREKALATAVRLLETTFIRIGNEEYARDNESFGLTTLRNRQVRVNGSTVRFQFRGKSGVHHAVQLSDRQLARIIQRMRDLPGYELFQYLDDSGNTHAIEASDVNAYLREAAGDDFTSKDFRTWAGTVLAAQTLQEAPPFGSEAEARRNIVAAVETTSRHLGNTKAVCRKCYIHPAIFDSYLEGTLKEHMKGRRTEAGVAAVLHAHRRREAREARSSGATGRSLAPLLARSLAASRRHSSRPAPRQM